MRRQALGPLVVLLVLAVSAASAPAERVDAQLPLGTAVTAAVDRPGDVTSLAFLVTQGSGRKLSISLKRAKTSSLEWDVALVAPDGTAVDVVGAGGKLKAKPTSWRASLPNVPQTGVWRLQVRGAEGTSGAFTALAKAKESSVATVPSPLPITPGATVEVPITVGADSELTVIAKRIGSTRLVPQLRIVAPDGSELEGGTPFIGNDSKGTLSLKKYRLPFFGTYILRFSGSPGTSGNLAYSAKAVAAKLKGTLPQARPTASSEAEPAMTARLDGSASVGSALSFRWAQVQGPAVVLTNAQSASPSFVAPAQPASLAFELSVAQNGVMSRGAVTVVEVGPRPVADAGRSMSVGTSAAVTLDATGSSHSGGRALRYSWRQMPGDAQAVTLTGADTATPAFTAPSAAGVLHFGLTVDDGDVRSFEDVLIVSVGDAARPVADAGRTQFVGRMSTVHLSGLGARVGGGVGVGSLAWTQIAGPAVTLAEPTSPWPSFTAPRAPADLMFRVTAGGDAGTADEVRVLVRPDETDRAPIAAANGPLNAPSGSVTITASPTTDADGDAMRFAWAQAAGSELPPAPGAPGSAAVDLPPGNSLYAYALQPNDARQYGPPDLVTVRNTAYSGAPVAHAGTNLQATPGATVTLDGRGSARTDGGGDPLTYRWRQVSARDWFDVAAESPGFDATVARPSFPIPTLLSSLTSVRTVTFELVVNDGATDSHADFVTVTISSIARNSRPVVTANASPGDPVAGATVTLEGTATDRDGDPIAVTWTRISGLVVALVPNSSTLSPTLRAPDSGTLRFRLVGNDGFEDSLPVETTVVVDAKPTATVVVDPISGPPGTDVAMSGQSSTDPEGAALTYTWTQTSGTPVTVTPGLDSHSIRFTAPAGTVLFRLVVNDGRQDSAAATGSFSSNAPPTVTAGSNLDPAAYGANVTLQATPGAGGPFTYSWRQINASGTDPAVTLSSTTAQSPTFSVPMPTSAPFGGTQSALPGATFGVTATSGPVSSAESTVRVRFFASLANNGQTTNTVYSVISSNCASCHSGTSSFCPVGSGSNARGYGMGTKDSFRTNGNTTACTSGANKPRIAAGNSGNSHIMERLKGTGPGAQMPLGGGSLSTTDINLIQDWIDQGAQDN